MDLLSDFRYLEQVDNVGTSTSTFPCLNFGISSNLGQKRKNLGYFYNER